MRLARRMRRLGGTNLVSYEPLLVEAFTKHDFTGVLARTAADLKKLNVNGKDGLTILGKFVERILTADPSLRYRDGFAEQPDKTCLKAPNLRVRKGTILTAGIPPFYMLVGICLKRPTRRHFC